MPALPGMPRAPPSDTHAAQHSQLDNVPPGYVYSHAPLPCAKLFNLDAYAKDINYNKDYISDSLSDERTSTGWYTICCAVIQLTSNVQKRAPCEVNMQVVISIDREEWDFWVYDYLQLADTLKYILQDIFICILKEQCSDKGESTWRW